MIPELNHFTLGGPQGDCWEWQRHKDKDGYGKVRYDGDMRLAHRVSFSVHNPNVDIKGKVILHLCDNPRCINPAHLRVGTQVDNIKDMVSKGRQYRPKGIKNPRCKLTEEQVTEIRELKGKQTAAAIGELYGVSRSTINRIHRGLIWK